ncbi:MAG TPA: MFS transporter [Acidimicrobiales bacterium]
MADETQRPSRATRRWIFVVTALGAFMASLDLSIVNVAFPALERAFAHDARATLSWVLTGYSIVFGSLLVVSGRTSDRLGAKRVFFWGLFVFSLGSLLCALAPSVALLIAGRVVQGSGAALVLPASLSLLLASAEPERRAQTVAMWGGLGALAVATGPSLGALLITAFGWRSAFSVNLPLALLAWLVGRRVLITASPTSSAKTSPDFPGVALITAALALLVLAISEGPSWGWSSASVIGSFGTCVVLLGLFLRRSLAHPEPVLDLSLFHARSFSVANAAVLLYAMGFFSMLLGNILFLTSVWHYSILRAGLAVTPGPMVVAVVSSAAGRQAARRGFRPVLLTGFVIFSAGLLWYVARVGVTPHFLNLWLPGTLVVGLGIGLTFPVLSAAAVSSLEPQRFAVGSAVNQTARQVGGAIGVAILVVLLGTPTSASHAVRNFHHLWLFAALMTALAGLLCVMITPARSSATPSEHDEAIHSLVEEVLDGESIARPSPNRDATN